MKIKLIVETIITKEGPANNIKYSLVKEVTDISDNYYLDDKSSSNEDVSFITSDVVNIGEKVLRNQIKLLFNNDDILLDSSDVVIISDKDDKYIGTDDTLIVDTLFLVKFKTNLSENKDELERAYDEFKYAINPVLNTAIDQYLENLK